MAGAITTFLEEHNNKINAVLDVALVGAASFAATITPERTFTAAGAYVFLGTGTAWLFGARVLRHYSASKPTGFLGEIALTLLLSLGTVVALIIAHAIAPGIARSVRAAVFVEVLSPAVVLARVVMRGGEALSKGPPDEIVIIGTGPLGRHTALALTPRPELHVFGHVSLPGEAVDPRLAAPVIGSSEEMDAILRAHPVDEVYVAGDVRHHAADMQAAVRVCERFGVPFALPINYLRLDRARPFSHAVDDGYLHYATVEPKPLQHAIKRLIDVLASVVALTLLSPLFVAVAIAIKVTSRGPLLFNQERVGQHGRHFYMLKFRSMVKNAAAMQRSLEAQNEQDGPVFKIRRDPRITRVGAFIRKFSIDELPQLINVLRGEMTLVGPRPPLPSEVAKYEAWQRRRLSVRPGITCLWQVSGRNEISFERWMYLDMQYIDHWSLAYDLELLAKTVPVVFLGRGAS